MNLRTLAEDDNAIILEDDVVGFATEIKITDPSGPTEYNVKGQYHRIGAALDPETGQQVEGNHSSVTVRLSSLGFGVLPKRDWEVETTDITGATVAGKVQFPMHDRTAGRTTLVFRVS